MMVCLAPSQFTGISVDLISSQVAFFALCMGLAGLIFFYIGVSMGWLYVCDLQFNRCTDAYVHTADFHGSDTWLGGGPNSALCNLEQG